MHNASIQSDLQARQRALDVSQSFIVQAPAGSGKTELLIQRFLSLLALVEHPEEVLAITFTKKAAAEMRLRVSQALESGRAGTLPDAAHARLTYDLAQKVLAQDQKQSWNLQKNPGRLRIQTMDALNAQIARMQPLTTAAATTGNAVLSESGLNEVYALAAASTFDHLASDSPYNTSVKAVLSHLDNDTGRYIRHVADMLKTRDQWLPLIGVQQALDFSDIRERLERTLAELIEQELASISNAVPKEHLPELFDLLRFAATNVTEQESVLTGFKEIHALPASDNLEGWTAIADFLLIAGNSFRKTVNIRQGFPPGKGDNAAQKERFKDLVSVLGRNDNLADRLHQIRRLPDPRYSDEQWFVLQSLLQLLILASAELQRLFLQRGSVDYIEIAMNAKRALGTTTDPGQVAMLLDYGLSHILVDEMQDTSISQYDFLKMLVAGWTPNDGRTLFCVGDPMQSIYRFRNAEVAQFLNAREQGIGDIQLEPLVLEQNFRSGSRLVDWFNLAFSTIFSDRDEPNQGAVSYARAAAAKHLEGQGKIVCHPVLGTSPEAEAEMTSETVAEILRQHPEDDVTVLVRSRTQVQELIPILRRQKISFRAVDIDRLTDLPEVIDLLALTRAAVHPGDRLAWLSILRAPWIGLHWQDLHALVSGDRESTVFALLQNSDRLAGISSEGRSAIERKIGILQELRSGSPFRSLSERIETTWYELAGPVLLENTVAIENTKRFFSVLRSLEIGGTLSDVAKLEEQLDAERASTTSDARLQLMTMHKSKGLQFDHLVLHGLGRGSRISSKSLLSWIEAVLPDSESPILAPIKPTEASKDDPIYSYIHNINKQKDSFENQRLLYVACTRAKQSLHLVGHVGVKAETNELEIPPKGTLLHLLWPIVGDQWMSAHADGQTVRNRDDGAEWLRPIRRVLAADYTVSVPPPPPLPQSAQKIPESPVEFEWAGQAAKLAGTLVHRWLQYVVEEETTLSQLHPAKRKPLEERWLREEGVNESDSQIILDRVDRALKTMQGDPRADWILHGDGETELALSGIVDQQLVSGVIDRVRIDQNEHWIIDYKTGVHEGGAMDRFLADEQRRYSDQLRKYRTLYAGLTGIRARTALYYPLMSEFVEVDLN